MKRLESLWIHGLLAAVAGLLLAWSNLHTPWARPLVDAVEANALHGGRPGGVRHGGARLEKPVGFGG